MFKLVPTPLCAADIIACARKLWGWSQHELVAYFNLVGVTSHTPQLTQSTLSRIEKGMSRPSVNDWVIFCEVLKIHRDSILYGGIEKNDYDDILKNRHLSSIAPPAKYLEGACIKSRALTPIFKYMEHNFSADVLENIFYSLEIDRLYFIALDNEINLRFVNDLIKRLLNEKFKNPETLIQEISKNILDPYCHGFVSKKYRKEVHPIERVSKFIEFSHRYQNLFLQRVVGKKENIVIFETVFNPVFKSFLSQVDPEIVQLLQNLITRYAVEMPFFGLPAQAKEFKRKWQHSTCTQKMTDRVTLELCY